MNWNAGLSPELQWTLDPEFRRLLGLDAYANVALAKELLSADLGGHVGRI
jgi:hypothetical protein